MTKHQLKTKVSAFYGLMNGKERDRIESVLLADVDISDYKREFDKLAKILEEVEECRKRGPKPSRNMSISEFNQFEIMDTLLIKPPYYNLVDNKYNPIPLQIYCPF